MESQYWNHWEYFPGLYKVKSEVLKELHSRLIHDIGGRLELYRSARDTSFLTPSAARQLEVLCINGTVFHPGTHCVSERDQRDG